MNEFSLPQFSRELQEHLDAHPLTQPGDTAPLLEPLGSGVVLLNLAGAAASGLSPAQLARACVLDSSPTRREKVWFREEWIPMERLYQEHFQIRRQANLIVE